MISFRGLRAGVPHWGASRAIEFLLADSFSVDDAAPLGSPRAADGKGYWQVVEGPSDAFEIAGGNLRRDTYAGSYADYFLIHAKSDETPIALDAADKAGFALYLGTLADRAAAGFSSSSTQLQIIQDYAFGVYRQGINGKTDYNLWPTNANVALVLRPHGGFVFVVAGGAAELVAWDYRAFTLVDLYPMIASINKADYPITAGVQIARFTRAAWSGDWTLATDYIAAPVADDAITSLPDAWVEFTWTPAAGETVDLMVRLADDGTGFSARCAESTVLTYGDTISIVELDGLGGGVYQDTQPYTFTVGTTYKLAVRLDGTSIQVRMDGEAAVAISHTSAVNQANTGVKVSQAGANLASWPLYLSGGALSDVLALAEGV